MLGQRFWIVRGAVTCALVGAVIAIGACGSSDDDGGSQGGAAAADRGGSGSGDSDFVATGSDEQQIRQVLHSVQEDYIEGDGPAFCDKLVAAEQRDVAAFGRNYGMGETCVETIEKASTKARAGGIEQNPTVVVAKPRVDGNQARVRVSDGGRPPEWMTLRKVSGEWRLVDSGLDADPIAAAQKRTDAQKGDRQR
jgi:hypothetical protein